MTDDTEINDLKIKTIEGPLAFSLNRLEQKEKEYPAFEEYFEDARKLAEIYAHGLAISEEVLRELVRMAHGSVRRVCVNLTNILEHANTMGWAAVEMTDLKEVSLFTGEAPARRV